MILVLYFDISEFLRGFICEALGFELVNCQDTIDLNIETTLSFNVMKEWFL